MGKPRLGGVKGLLRRHTVTKGKTHDGSPVPGCTAGLFPQALGVCWVLGRGSFWLFPQSWALNSKTEMQVRHAPGVLQERAVLGVQCGSRVQAGRRVSDTPSCWCPACSAPCTKGPHGTRSVLTRVPEPMQEARLLPVWQGRAPTEEVGRVLTPPKCGGRPRPQVALPAVHPCASQWSTRRSETPQVRGWRQPV